MTNITIPDTGYNKALFIIDVQPLTCDDALIKGYEEKIARFVKNAAYDAYVLAEYYAPAGSMFERQRGILISKEEAGPTSQAVLDALDADKSKVFNVMKTTRSCFKGNHLDELLAFLRFNDIEEAHFVGFDINDCVLASAYEAVDLGFYSFVIEELCHHNAGNEELKHAALTIFRQQNMTNNSVHEKLKL